MVNLVRNAKYACDESGRPDRLVIIRVEAAGPMVRLSVIDNGIGIAADDMRRLFSHGFTTKKSGHGFGLHSAALAARELGGTLTAQSEGRGCGAKFVLELPREAPHG
jgi:signal transduction histidine kinase